jgi:hypothetical protein
VTFAAKFDEKAAEEVGHKAASTCFPFFKSHVS